MDSLEILAFGWALIALSIFGFQATRSHKNEHEDIWNIKQHEDKH
ncbi:MULTISPECIES: hypothetical protein [Reichenbachiella]|uniref:Uncharacterized protein n=1 Tax=Reichenbachiella agariperforans TaxID=156994 RepID=A0A1M6WL62_REIAG|nr:MULTISPECIES: hypothetical protein [Reichenbachiella]SHK94512.1 hypothetical protein SAMN04488028_11338 [Reichenbachiella agariperforans]